MKRQLGGADVVIAGILALAVSVWAFVFSAPYPRPSLWADFVKLQGLVSPAALGVLGRLAVGVFAAFSYFALRQYWLQRFSSVTDGSDMEISWRERALPVAGALFLCFLPPVWRSAQFLSTRFLVLGSCVAGVFFWLQGRGYRRGLPYFTGYLLFGLSLGLNPLCGILFICAFSLDVVARFQTKLDSQGFAGPVDAEEISIVHNNAIEVVVSVVGAAAGLLAGILAGGSFHMVGARMWTLPALIAKWFEGWSLTLYGSLTSPYVAVIVVAVVLELLAVELARRIVIVGSDIRVFARTSSAIVFALTVFFVLRSVDRPERERLALIHEYVRSVVASCGNARWLFTDGRFDDAIRLEMGPGRRRPVLLDTLNVPTDGDSAELRALAPDPSERDIFAAGGSEVFRAWARERPDRLAESAWQLGSNVIRFHGKAEPRTSGAVIRYPSEGGDPAAFAAADARFIAFSARLVAVAETVSRLGFVFESVGGEVERKFSELLWRVARLAAERSQQLAVGDEAFRREEELMRRLDALNEAQLVRYDASERILPTFNLALTAREGLSISLRRSDYELAQRFAREVIKSAPEDFEANFALGISCLEKRDYRKCVFYLLNVLRQRPDESDALRHIATAYLKLGQVDEARAYAERALKVRPDSEEVRKLLSVLGDGRKE